MKEETKNYLLKTFIALALVAFGAYAYSQGGRINQVLGGACFITGFIIMLVIYGSKWFDWWN